MKLLYSRILDSEKKWNGEEVYIWFLLFIYLNRIRNGNFMQIA